MGTDTGGMTDDLLGADSEYIRELINILKPEKIVCPECGSENIQKWNPKTGKCPKCGGDMKATGTYVCVD